MPIRVLLCDDHQIVLDSLSLLIASMTNIEVVGALNDSRKVSDFIEVHDVNVLLTDMSMPFLTGTDLALRVRSDFPHVKILMLTVSEDVETVREAFQAGVSGYVMKTAGKKELEKAIITVAGGEKFFSESVMFKLVSHPGAVEEADAKPAAVTTRELEVIKLIAQEMSTSEIAEHLFVSVGTVETHRHNILRKLGVKNAIGIIKYAMRHKLI